MRTICLFLAVTALAAAAPREFSSGPVRTQLLELFTSEGCSSCPPAEAWLGELRAAPGLWRDFVPVAWHVTYWDRLGWTDRLATRAATARQHAYAEAWQSRTVYTPAFVLDGHDWRGPRRAPPASPENVGLLRVAVAGETVRVTFAPAADGEFTVHAATLGLGLITDVKRGENGGRRLRHDFVAGEPFSAPLPGGRAEFALPAAPAGAVQRALAVWIVRRGGTAPVQAAGGPLD